MQVTLKSRETITGVVTIESIAVDTNGMSLLTVMLTLYAISGTAPNLAIQLQTSNDLETWVNFGTPFNLGATGSSVSAAAAGGTAYQRYIRAQIALTGTTPLVSYSLWVNLFASS